MPVEVPVHVGEDNTPQLLALIDRCLEKTQTGVVRRNLEKRRRVLEALMGRPDWQDQVKRWCRERGGIKLFVNLFGWQTNPRKKAGKRIGAFVLWPFQERALTDRPETTGRKGMLWCVENLRPFCAQKSRDLGLTWIILFLEMYLAIFQEDSQIGNISRTEKAVDSASHNSLFWKLRFIRKYLPSWLTGAVQSQKKFMGFEWSRSGIDGEASTGEAYSSGRASLVFVDEAAKVKDLEAIRQSLASVTDCVGYNSTHLGAGTAFHKLTKEPAVVQFTFHWTRHPEKNNGLYSSEEDGRIRFWEYVEAADEIVEIPGPKDPALTTYEFDRSGRPTGGPHPRIRSPWYDMKAADIGTARGVAEELDIDPAGSQYRPFDHAEVARLKRDSRSPLWEGDVEVDSAGKLVRLIERAGGPLKLWVKLNNGVPPDAPYGAGGDIAAGTGATPSCLWFTNGKNGEMVALYVDANILPDQLAFVAAALCRLFCGAKIAWEHLGPGVTFGKTLMERARYFNCYRMGEEDARAGPIAAKPGFRTNRSVKNVLLTRFYLALHNGECACYDEETLDEMFSFAYDATGQIVHPHEAGKDPSQARENHGDRVMAGALSCKMVLEGGRLSCQDREPEAPIIKPEDNVMTFAGRQAFRDRGERARAGW